MSSSGFVALCNALRENQTLEKIALSQNLITAEALVAFKELLLENTALTSVGMCDCRISVAGCRHIADGLVGNAVLGDLNLSRNGIDIDGMKYLLDALLGNYAMMRIEWTENPFAQHDESANVITQIHDILERNNYYLHNLLMRDMAALVRDLEMM
jgi:Ran GTPase-activating protein (RanGAP) involved in mRNA processing and transport